MSWLGWRTPTRRESNPDCSTKFRQYTAFSLFILYFSAAWRRQKSFHSMDYRQKYISALYHRTVQRPATIRSDIQLTWKATEHLSSFNLLTTNHAFTWSSQKARSQQYQIQQRINEQHAFTKQLRHYCSKMSANTCNLLLIPHKKTTCQEIPVDPHDHASK